MKQLFRISFLMLMLGSASIAFSQLITLDEAVKEGLENNFSMKIAASQVRKSQQLTRQALGSLGPTLDAQASYERYDAVPQFGGGGSGNIDSKRVSLVLGYPVDFAGLAQKSLFAAKANEGAANETFNAEKQAAIYQIRLAYFEVVKATERVSVEQKSLEAVQRRLKDIQRRFEVGDLPKFEVIRTETEVVRQESSLLESQNNLSLTKKSLNNTMARPIDTPIEVITENTVPVVEFSEPQLVEAAWNLRPELKELDFRLKATKFVTFIQRGGLTPSLRLQALYTRTIDPPTFSRENNGTFSAVLSIPLFDSGITRAKIKASREDEKQIELNQEKLKLAIALEVKSALTRIDNAKSLLRLALKTEELQLESLRIAEIRYKNGEGVYLDVITGQADLKAAQVNLVNARYEMFTAISQLQFAIGTSDIPVKLDPANAPTQNK